MPTAVAILRQGDVLIASPLAALTDAELIAFRDELSEQVGESKCRGVILDVEGLDVLDSFAARTFMQLARVLRLRGAELVIVGIRPDVASTMAYLSIDLAGTHTALDLDSGLAYLGARVPSRGRHE